MGKTYTYTVGTIKRLIAENNKNEFKPVMGTNVESEDKKNNKKAYSDAKKRAKDYDGGLVEPKKTEPKVEKMDGNKTMLSLNPETVDEKYKERIAAQAEGYTSTLEKNNGIEKDPSAEFNKRTFKAVKDEAEQMRKNIQNDKESGLKSNNLAQRDPDYFKKETVYENVKNVNFGKLKFLSEEHMISRIPDEMKCEGQKFHMKDNAGNDYLVEWSENSATILEHKNPIALQESLDRMRQLYNYKPSDYTKKAKGL